MALIKTSNAIANIRGRVGGNIFKRDRSGLHIHASKRHIKGRSKAQKRQRSAFTVARRFSKNNRQVSYNIHRTLTGLEPKPAPLDFYPDMK